MRSFRSPDCEADRRAGKLFVDCHQLWLPRKRPDVGSAGVRLGICSSLQENTQTRSVLFITIEEYDIKLAELFGGQRTKDKINGALSRIRQVSGRI